MVCGCIEFDCGHTDVRSDGRTFLPGLLSNELLKKFLTICFKVIFQNKLIAIMHWTTAAYKMTNDEYDEKLFLPLKAGKLWNIEW